MTEELQPNFIKDTPEFANIRIAIEMANKAETFLEAVHLLVQAQTAINRLLSRI